jgi:hypothetical protein
MQRQPILDSSSENKFRMGETGNSSTRDEFSKRKRTRVNNTDIWTRKEEERILKYALKLSEKEYLTSIANEKNSQITKLDEIESVQVFNATEEDFSNPLKYFDGLWDLKANSTGIVKIIPPEKWVEKQRLLFENEMKVKIQNPHKKLETRKQVLGHLYMAKVSNLFNFSFLNSR